MLNSHTGWERLLAWGACLLLAGFPLRADTGLIAHWPLAGDCRDHSGHGNHGRNHGADLTTTGPDGKPNRSAGFDGRNDYIEVEPSPSLRLGTRDFSITAWVHTDELLDDVLGDVISKYDPAARKGFVFNIMNYAGVTSSQPNYRNVAFGIDNAKLDQTWTDCGRPGNNLFVCALAVYEGHLYAGTFETGPNESGHVYRYVEGTQWVDCGSPDKSNSVFSLAVFQGKLYAGTACYQATRGSALPDSPNQAPGGKVYRYDGGTTWTICGQLENADTGTAVTVHSLAVYGGKLYASAIYEEGFGLYEYQHGQEWAYKGNPGRRVETLGVYNGHLYTTSYDDGVVFRYDPLGQWKDLGTPAGATQTYGFMVYEGRLHVTTWPNGSVFHLDGDDDWVSTGQLGEEKEVMGASVYNGKLYAGTLPLAQVYRHDGGTTWTSTGRLDRTPNVTYRRAWSMAVYNGKLYCGTLPSGKVFSIEAGKCVTYDRELKPGWRHLAAVRNRDSLQLYVDAERVATSSTLDPADFDISNDVPLRIGSGAHDYFRGRISDVRVYDRALNDADVGSIRFIGVACPDAPKRGS